MFDKTFKYAKTVNGKIVSFSTDEGDMSLKITPSYPIFSSVTSVMSQDRRLFEAKLVQITRQNEVVLREVMSLLDPIVFKYHYVLIIVGVIVAIKTTSIFDQLCLKSELVMTMVASVSRYHDESIKKFPALLLLAIRRFKISYTLRQYLDMTSKIPRDIKTLLIEEKPIVKGNEDGITKENINEEGINKVKVKLNKKEENGRINKAMVKLNKKEEKGGINKGNVNKEEKGDIECNKHDLRAAAKKDNQVDLWVDSGVLFMFIVLLTRYFCGIFNHSGSLLMLGFFLCLSILCVIMIGLVHLDYVNFRSLKPSANHDQFISRLFVTYTAVLSVTCLFPTSYHFHLLIFSMVTLAFVFSQQISPNYISNFFVYGSMITFMLVFTTFLVGVSPQTNSLDFDSYKHIPINQSQFIIEWNIPNYEIYHQLDNPFYVTPDTLLLVEQQLWLTNMTKQNRLVHTKPFSFGSASIHIISMSNIEMKRITLNTVLYVCSKSCWYRDYEWCQKYAPSHTRTISIDKKELLATLIGST